jgi:glycosyltransferase involved in cell wall biosynthesis
MKKRPRVVYVSPNRSHHYRYAEGLERAGILHRFVSGFPRVSRKAKALEVRPEKIMRCDAWQLLYLASLRGSLSNGIREWLNRRSRRALDQTFTRAMAEADIGLSYNGTGLATLRQYRGTGRLFVCEAVNTHIVYQRRVLRDEARRIGFEWDLPDAWTVPGRVAEYEEADYILGPSHFVRDAFYAEGIPEERFLLNPYGFSMPGALSGKKSKNAEEPFTVLYVGQLNFRKGIRYLIEAFDRLAVPAKRLRLVGSMVAPTGFEQRALPAGVELAGVLKDEALAQAYASAHVFVQPSIEEGLSLVLGEAMGAGLPVIATTATGAEEIIVHGESGFLVAPRDVPAITSRLQSLASDEVLRRRIADRARGVAESLGGWKTSGDRLAQILEAVWNKHWESSKPADHGHKRI